MTGPPAVAARLAVSVSMLVPVAGFVPNPAVTPLGRPDAASVTLPVKPLAGVTVIVLVPLAPCATLKVVGLAESVKSGGGVTVRLIVVVCVRLPDLPVTVTVVGPPTAAEPLAVSVKILVVVVLVGLKDAVTPVGRVEVTVKATVPVKPLVGATVIVLVPLVPCAILNVLGAAESVKFGGAVTVRLIVVVCVRLPEVPVMVTVVGPLAVAEAPAVSVKTLVVVVLVGLNEAVTPVGRVEVTARATVPEKPPVEVTVMVLVPPARVGVIVRLLGAAASEKLAVAVTTTGTELLCPVVTAE